jgi:hypothetical protein
MTVRGYVLSRLAATMAAALAMSSACTCTPPVELPPPPALLLTIPAAVTNPDGDVEPSQAGVQVRATVRLENGDNTRYTAVNATVTSDGFEGLVQRLPLVDNSATFTLTLTSSPQGASNRVVVTSAGPGDEPVLTVAATTVVTDTAPTGGDDAVCTITTPTDGATLSADADPARRLLQSEVSVTCIGGDLENTLEQDLLRGGRLVLTARSTDSDVGPTVQEVNLEAHRATTLVTFPANGAHALTAQLLGDNDNSVVFDDGEAFDSINVTVQQVISDCVIDIVAPSDGAVFSSSSTDFSADPGFQIEVVVEASEDCGEVRLLVDGTERGVGLPGAGGQTRVVVTVPEGSVRVGAAGSGASDEIQVRVDLTGPRLTLTTPDLTFDDDNNNDPCDGISTTLDLNSDGVGGSYSLRCTSPSGAVSEQQGTLGDGAAFSDELTLQNLTLPSCTLDVIVVDDLGNESTASSSFAVATRGNELVIAFTRDTAPLGFINAAEDADRGTVDVDVPVRVTGVFSDGEARDVTLSFVNADDGTLLVPVF